MVLIAICGFLVWQLLPGWENEFIFIAGLPLVFLLLCLVAATLAVWNTYELTAENVRKKTILGTREFRRDDYLAHELLSERPGKRPSLMLRFRTGVLHLEGDQLGIDPNAVLDYVQEVWGVHSPVDGVTFPGEVGIVQVLRYESLHVSLALISGICLLAVSVKLPLIWVGAVLAVLCFRIVWRTLGRVETSEQGVTYVHQFLAPVRIEWSQIESVTYWNSFCQGGVRIRGNGRSIRLYRWIENYPKFNRLLHDQVPAERFAPQLNLPVKVSLNQWQVTGTMYSTVLVAANALPFLTGGSPFVFVGFAVVPVIVGAGLMLISRRYLEIDREEIRDVSVICGVRKVNRFKRAEVLDARLGRQISAGGLWIKFKSCRIEIRNLNAGTAPEQLLACLRRDWAWEQNPPRVEAKGDGGAQDIRGVA